MQLGLFENKSIEVKANQEKFLQAIENYGITLEDGSFFHVTIGLQSTEPAIFIVAPEGVFWTKEVYKKYFSAFF